ncbi:MAG TPA: hypothetical protein VK891_08480 [Euzebyales bacterium]|nr:hypothetical protein [Euzebyales bacterium]
MTADSNTSNVRHTFAAAALVCVLVASLLSLVATPASACTTTLRAPYKKGEIIGTTVTNGNCNPGWFLLDRQRWWGWQAAARGNVPHNSSRTISANCENLRGTYTYRASYGTSLHYHNGPTKRLTC